MNPSQATRIAALYLRVSTDQQISGLMSQERAVKEYCKLNGITDYKIFKDENQSGSKISRPALDQMMKAVREGQISTVIVFAFSRFARSTTHLLDALNEFKRHNTEFVSITEKIETNSPMGVAMFTILGALSQMERELISQRVRAGLANARAQGKQIGRKKTRPSEIIRALLRQKMTFREIAKIAGCSHGCISAEKKEMLNETRMAEKTVETPFPPEPASPKPTKPNLTLV